MTRELRRPLVIVASAALIGLLVALDVSGPVRVAVALWFLLVCPGMALLPLLGGRLRPLVELALVPLVSIVLDTLVATALTLAGRLSVTSGLLALAGLSLIGCGLQLLSAQVPDSPERRDGQAASRAQGPVPSPDR